MKPNMESHSYLVGTKNYTGHFSPPQLFSGTEPVMPVKNGISAPTFPDQDGNEEFKRFDLSNQRINLIPKTWSVPTGGQPAS